jgi:hypothetical protein
MYARVASSCEYFSGSSNAEAAISHNNSHGSHMRALYMSLGCAGNLIFILMSGDAYETFIFKPNSEIWRKK